MLDNFIKLCKKTQRGGGRGYRPGMDDLFICNLKSDVNATIGDEQFSILHMAVYQYSQLLLFSSAPSNSSAFFKASEEKKTDLLELIQLAVQCGADINAPDKYGRPPIFFAGDQKISNLLLACGAKISASTLSFSALHVQVFLRARCFATFLKNNEQALTQDEHGRLPLHWALIRPEITFDEIKLLIDAAPESVEICDKDGIYSLGYASLYADDEVFSLLLHTSPRYVIDKTIEQINQNIIQLDETYQAPTTEPSASDEISRVWINTTEGRFTNRSCDPRYMLPDRFQPIDGGGGKSKSSKKRKKITDMTEVAETKAPSFITVNDRKVNLTPDRHGIKHTEFSHKLTSHRCKHWGTTPATFLPEFKGKYHSLLRDIILSRAKEGQIEGYVEMPEVIGIDLGFKTKTIELYYDPAIGSHIRPKYFQPGEDQSGLVFFNPEIAESDPEPAHHRASSSSR